MKCCFIYRPDDRWKDIGMAIARYVKYCLEGIDGEIEVKKKDNNLIIIPLFEEKEGVLEPLGLDIVKEIRKKGNFKSGIFLVTPFKSNVPDCFNPERVGDIAKDIIRNPKFGDTERAVLLGELMYTTDDSGKTEILNVAHLVSCNGEAGDLKDKLRRTIEKHKSYDSRELEHTRKAYYKTFVEFYDRNAFGEIDKNGRFDKKLCAFIRGLDGNEEKEIRRRWNQAGFFNLIDAQLFLETADAIYNLLNGIKTEGHSGKGGHRGHIELFRAPLAFPLQELLDAKKEIEEALTQEDGKTNKIRLLLIDNKWDKCLKKSNGRIEFADLPRLLENFGLSDLFEIEILGNSEIYKERNSIFLDFRDGSWKLIAKNNEIEKQECKWLSEFGKNEEDEAFRLKEFRNKEDNNYALKVYDRLKSCHFILLDFFLDRDNTYFAFDFIKDITKIKRSRNDFSTTWYFITSAIYDAVVKYSQSGLLAEYYESAVVNAGDDPTNKKRQIIFVYKLLTFIYSRIKSFRNHWIAIDRWLGKSCQSPKTDRCLECLENIMLVARKFHMEWKELHDVFPGLKETKGNYRDLAVYLDSLIRSFLWLPEADWQVTQLHIEMVNKKLKESGEEKEFSCNYITEKIKKASEVY